MHTIIFIHSSNQYIHMNPSAALTPASQLFAWEMARALPVHGDSGRCRTPSGIHSRETAYIGALIETVSYHDRIVSLRMSDPTGICTVHIDPRAEELYDIAEELDVPSFVYVFGTIRTRSQGGEEAEISATVLRPVSRDARNSWILSAASDAAERISRLPEAEREEFRSLLLNAVTAAKPAEKKQEMSDEEVLSLIESCYEGKSAPREKVLEALKGRGMTKQQAAECIARLMEEGECYAPKPDIIKLA